MTPLYRKHVPMYIVTAMFLHDGHASPILAGALQAPLLKYYREFRAKREQGQKMRVHGSSSGDWGLNKEVRKWR